MIVFKTLEWNNMFSYGANNIIHFDTDKVTQLLGKNGYGKSSIALILEEVLYNKNSKGKKKASIINRYTKDKQYSAKLTFTKYDDVYTVEIIRSSTQKVTLTKNNIDISSHTATATYKLIEEILGIDHKTFSQIVYKSNSTSLEFLSGTDIVRKKFLIELLNLTKYTDIGNAVKELASSLSKEASKLEAKISTTQSFIDKYQKADLEPMELVDIPILPDDLLDKRVEIQSAIKNIDSLNRKIAQNNTYIACKDSIILEPIPEIPVDNRQKFIARKGELEKVVRDNTTNINKWEALGNKCPTCEQTIDREKVKELTSKYSTEIKEANCELTNICIELQLTKKALDEYKKAKQNVEEWERYHSLIDTSLPTELYNKEKLQNELADISTKISQMEASISRSQKHNNEASAKNSKIALIKEQIADAAKELKLFSDELSLLQERINYVNILSKTFSMSGLVAYKIECMIKDLEDASNDYLVELSNGRFQITFELSGVDKLDCKIIDNSHIVDITDLSSGELSSISVAVLLAIRKLMQCLSSTKINLLFLDETIAYLDTEAKERLIEILLAEDYLNTFLVSHDYTHPLLTKININKENNISTINKE